MFAGHTSTGGVVSRTVTRNEQLASFAAASVAVTFTRVSPSANVAPGWCVALTTGVLTRSVGAADSQVTAAPSALVASALISAGQPTDGAFVSRTVTTKVHSLVWFDASFAVTVTVVAPRAKVLPGSCV